MEILIADQRTLMEEVEQAHDEAETLLDNGEKQQQVADELMADADQARGIAHNAVNQAEKTLEDAYDTLDTIKGEPSDSEVIESFGVNSKMFSWDND